MCTIERFDIVYPDGRHVPSQHLRYCDRGTPSRPCSNVQVIQSFEDRYAAADDLNFPTTPEYRIAGPRGLAGSSSGPGSKDKPKDLTLSFKFWNPFKSKERNKFYTIRKKRPQNDLPAVIPPYPRAPTPPPLPRAMPERGRSPNIVNISPPRKSRSPSPRPRKRQPKRKQKCHKTTIVVQHNSSSSEDDPPSSPVAARDHQRKSRSISLRSRYEIEKGLFREKKWRQYAENVAREEEQARKRALKLAEIQRLERKKAEQKRIEYEERKRLETAERTRRRQAQEDHQRAQAKRQQELEDLEALKAAERAEQRAEERAFRHQEEQDRRRREEHDRLRADEAARIARAHRANIPRQPRHEAAVHHPPRSMEDRGDRFIREAIRKENLRRFER